MELSALAMLNPLGSEIVSLTPLQLMPFKLQAKSTPTVLSQVWSLHSHAYLHSAHSQCTTMQQYHVTNTCMVFQTLNVGKYQTCISNMCFKQ